MILDRHHPCYSPVRGPAFWLAVDMLSDRQWRFKCEVTDAIVSNGILNRHGARKLIRDAVDRGEFEAQGLWTGDPNDDDTRTVRLCLTGDQIAELRTIEPLAMVRPE